MLYTYVFIIVYYANLNPDSFNFFLIFSTSMLLTLTITSLTSVKLFVSTITMLNISPPSSDIVLVIFDNCPGTS